MAIKSLPKAITKDILFKEAQKRFLHWANTYAKQDISAQHMYEDLSCSVFSGDPEDDFPIEFKAEQDTTIKYQYDDGNCFFMIDGIKVEVLDLRSMRESPRTCIELYVDVCVLSVSFIDESECYNYHIIPDIWLYGSTSDDFNEGKPVDDYFINAAREYIKAHHITKEMQEVED